MEKGSLDSAVIEYKKAIRLDPSLYQAHYNLGVIHANRKDYEAVKNNVQKR